MSLFVKPVVAGPAMDTGMVGEETVGPEGTIVSKVNIAVAGNGPVKGQLNGGSVDRSSQTIRALPLSVTEGKKYSYPTRVGLR